jgi:hypothetical protein
VKFFLAVLKMNEAATNSFPECIFYQPSSNVSIIRGFISYQHQNPIGSYAWATSEIS